MISKDELQTRLQALRDAAQAWGNAHKELMSGIEEVLGKDEPDWGGEPPEWEKPAPELGYLYEELQDEAAHLETYVNQAFVKLG